MSILRLSVLVIVFATFWTPSTAVDSSTLRLARSRSLSPPNTGAPLTAWAASIAAQSAADASRMAALLAVPVPLLDARPKSKCHSRGRLFVPIAPGRQILSIPNYVARSRLGTPAQTLLVAIDPSNDAAWIPCSSCVGCAPAATSPSFSPTQSSTYRPDGTGAAASAYTFGCLRVVTGGSVPPQGLLGFGRGPLSFLLQTKDMYGSVFSYCLPSYKSSNFSGTLRLGPVGQPKRIKTTPLLYNPHRPTLYYVDMTGIRVGGNRQGRGRAGVGARIRPGHG
ncbi:hypothetical protein ACQ4PT_005285 [Festuca glaucescens]